VTRRLALLLAPLLLVALAAPAFAREALPVGPDVDYQLGGARSVPANVGIVVRDRTARPVPGLYNVCYVNGFQTQQDESGFWKRRMGLVLKRHGRPVVDEAWGEWLLNVRTPRKRTRLAHIMGTWAKGCAARGYDAVEFDNLDSYTRSHGLLERRQAIAYARLLVRAAHAAGLAAGQKNLADFNGRSVGYDFAVAEECGRYQECGDYVATYGRRVLSIEYRRQDFRWTCAHFGGRLAVVLRDLDLTPTGVREWC
jgi:hypothetical protein